MGPFSYEPEITPDQARDILDLAAHLSVTDAEGHASVSDKGGITVAELQQIAQEADIAAEYLEQAIAQYLQTENVNPNQVHSAVKQEIKSFDATELPKHKRSSLIKKRIFTVFVGLLGISGFLSFVPCYYNLPQREYQGASHMLIQSVFDYIKILFVLTLSLQLVLVSVRTWRNEEELRPQLWVSLSMILSLVTVAMLNEMIIPGAALEPFVTSVALEAP